MMELRALRCAVTYWIAALVLAASGGAFAGDGTSNLAGKNPSKKEIVKALKTRSITPGAITTGTAAAGPSTVVPQKVSFDQIVFEFNSDKISTKAKEVLDRIGQALSDRELRGMVFVIEGHTDATGALPYNMKLSERRAESVKRYLLQNHQIAAARLKTEGKGPTDLLDGKHPQSHANRRVVFVAASL